MNKIYKRFIAVSVFAILCLTTFAQKNYFSDISEGQARMAGGTRFILPNKYRTVSMDAAQMKSFLWSLPSEKNVQNRKMTPVLSIPMPDGRIATFNVWESSIQEAALQEKFPDIKTFLGQGISDPYATIRFDYTPRGFHAQVLTPNGTYYIDPYANNSNGSNYVSYFRTDYSQSRSFICGVTDNLPTSNAGLENTEAVCLGTQLRTFRLAVACTGEYAQAPGIAAGSNAAILHAAIVTSVNRVVGVYEKEVAVRMVLVANNNLVEFLDPATDPFNGNNNANVLINESQTVIDANIGFSNYDIGHTFSTGGGGLAQLQSPCGSGKARGITGLPNPTGDEFDIDFVAHEIGHQFGGSHTFNGQVGNCSGGNRSGPSAYEPGSGTTIQAYAGICGTDNLQPNSDPVFHARSFDQISDFIVSGTGQCGIITSTGNGIPVIGPLANNGLTIPISTPFTLTGSATDPNNDPLTYCWEQWDLGPQGPWNGGASAAANNTLPLFKSRVPKTNGSRTFPDISVILAGYPANPPATLGGLKGEILSSVPRTMNFRLTVRDNKAAGGGVASAGGGGCQSSTPFVVNVAGTTPFAVTSPNGGESYPAGSTQTITWNNAATTAAPFNVANVRISFSTDGGLTYPTTILASTANDGTESVSMPASVTTTARIRIEAIGNIFFDISNANFTLTTPPTGYTFGTAPTATTACPAGASITTNNLSTSSFGGFTNPITLAATGNPAGTTVSFSSNPLTPGNSTTVTLNNTASLPAGTYTVNISGTATGVAVQNTTATFTITAGAGPVISTQPTNVTVCAPATATFTVASAAAGVTYQWQSAPTVGGTYANIAGATNASYTTGATSAGMNGMAFRCIVSQQCGSTTSSAAVLTVNSGAAITTQPANTSACTGNPATVTVVATGTGLTYQWASATAAGGPFMPIATATSASYTIPSVTVSTPQFYQVTINSSSCPGMVMSSVAQVTISQTAAIGTQPTAQTVCAGTAATLSVAATGTGITYQWQSGTSATGPWTNVAGATAASYNTGATTATMNGTFYQVVVTGSCNAVTSSAVLLTVNTAAAITTQPTPVTLCNGATAAFTSAATGTGVTYQWQSGPTATGPWTNVSTGTGGTTQNYTTVQTTPAMNGTYYRVVATTTTCAATVNSNPVLLTVNTVAVIGTQPAAQSACIPQTATFNVAATGTGLTYQWESAAALAGPYTAIAGATATSYTTSATTLAMNGTYYRVSILSTCSPATPTVSSPALLSVTSPVTITAQPTNQRGCVGDNYTFNATASSPGNTITFQWQVSTTGAAGSFTNIAGATGTSATPSYAITAAQSFLNGYWYRVIFSVPCGTGVSSVVSDSARLSMSFKPAITLTYPTVSNTNPALNNFLFTTVSPAAGNFVYNWTKNGSPIPNSTATTQITLPVDDAGTYVVSVTDPTTGCRSNTATVTTNAATSDNLLLGRVFVYPNPVNDILTVRYNTSGLTNRATSVAVYDEKGALVFNNNFPITGTLGRMQIDMSRFRPATYMVYVVDAGGKKLSSTRVIKQP
jgi:Metallo-peptidase family M12B Reprolysin-like/Secretion system C-terminal sorting domain